MSLFFFPVTDLRWATVRLRRRGSARTCTAAVVWRWAAFRARHRRKWTPPWPRIGVTRRYVSSLVVHCPPLALRRGLTIDSPAPKFTQSPWAAEIVRDGIDYIIIFTLLFIPYFMSLCRRFYHFNLNWETAWKYSIMCTYNFRYVTMLR